MSQGMRKHHCPKFVEKQNHRSQIDGIDGGDSAMSGVDTRIIMASSRTATATRQVTVRGRGMAVADDQQRVVVVRLGMLSNATGITTGCYPVALDW